MVTAFESHHPKVLIVEDESDLRDAMVTYLNMEGFVADGVGSLQAAGQWMKTHRYDILVLDLGLPDGDGLTWLGQQADMGDKGVIITTARGDDANRILGVKSGADIYLVKPVLLEELTSLIGNLMRRIRPMAQKCWRLSAMNWHIESPEGLLVGLTHPEHTLLTQLAALPGKAVPRDKLVISLGHDPELYDPRRMEIMVRRLRTKAKETLGYALPLQTVHRSGYAFTASIEIS